MIWPFVSQPHFPFQVWPDLEWNQDSPDPRGELLRPLTRSWFLVLFLGTLFLFALPLLFGTCFSSLWSPPFSLHIRALIFFSIAEVRLSLTLTLSHLTIWWSRQIALFYFPLVKAAMTSCLLLSLWHRGHPFLFGRHSLFTFFRWSLRHSASSPLVSVAPTSLLFLFSPFSTFSLSSLPCFLLPQTLWQM